MEIIVLGTGCVKCKRLEKSVRQAVEETGIEANVTKIEDIEEIIKFGVMITPALVIDNKVVLKGSVPSIKNLSKLLCK